MRFTPKSPYETILPNALCLGKLHIRGGDGDAVPAKVEVEVKSVDPGGSSGSGSEAASTDDAGSDSDKRIRDLEGKLDKEKQDKIQLKREADEAQSAIAANAKESLDGAKQVELERDDYKAKYEKMKEFVETGYLDTAILKDKKYEWHDVEAVRAFLDKGSIRLDMDTGGIEGLDMELKRIAKDKPYLLIPKETDGSGAPPATGTPTSGSHPFGGTARQRETDRNKIGSKYKLPGFGPGRSVG